jgi:hypothetical protein
MNQAYDDYSPRKANRIFLTLHGCMMEVMKVGGGNNYDIPHIRKEMFKVVSQFNSTAMLHW